MRLFELFEAKSKKAPAVKNPVAKNAKVSGSGSHTDKKHNRTEKHKKDIKEE